MSDAKQIKMRQSVTGLIENAVETMAEIDGGYAYSLRQMAKNLHWLRTQHEAGNSATACEEFFDFYATDEGVP